MHLAYSEMDGLVRWQVCSRGENRVEEYVWLPLLLASHIELILYMSVNITECACYISVHTHMHDSTHTYVYT